MKGNLAGFTLSAAIHIGLILLAVYGLSASTIPPEKDTPVPLRLAMFQAPEPEPKLDPIVKSKAKPIQPEKKAVSAKPKSKPSHKIKEKQPKKKIKKKTQKKVAKKEAKKPQKTTPTKKSDKKLDDLIHSLQTQKKTAPQKPIKQPKKQTKQATSNKETSRKVTKVNNNSAKEQQYKARLRRLIASQKKYPARAKRNGEEGTVVIAFTIAANGNISNISVSRSSGSHHLDQSAVNTVKKISGRLPFPAEIKRKQWQLSLPLVYHLR